VGAAAVSLSTISQYAVDPSPDHHSSQDPGSLGHPCHAQNAARARAPVRAPKGWRSHWRLAVCVLLR
jgi:hypothetical protein